MKPKSNVLLMTCRVLVQSVDGTLVESRALLDSGSSTSFVSECLSKSLCLPRSSQNTLTSGIACFSSKTSSHSTTQFCVRSIHDTTKLFHINAMNVPKVTCDLPLHSLSSRVTWDHISDLKLADPEFGVAGRIDLLLGIDTYIEVMGNGLRIGDPNTPVTFETHFGWVLAGSASSQFPVRAVTHIASHHALALTGDELIQRFWETEEVPSSEPIVNN